MPLGRDRDPELFLVTPWCPLHHLAQELLSSRLWRQNFEIIWWKTRPTHDNSSSTFGLWMLRMRCHDYRCQVLHEWNVALGKLWSFFMGNWKLLLDCKTNCDFCLLDSLADSPKDLEVSFMFIKILISTL